MPHPFAAAARRRFDQQRKTDLRRDGDDLFVAQTALPFGAGHDGHARFLHGRARHGLIAHRGDGGWLGPDELDPLVDARLREVFALGQKAVAGMDRIRAGLARHLQNLIGAQIRFARRRRPDEIRFVGVTHVQRIAIDIGVDGDGVNAQLAAGPLNA